MYHSRHRVTTRSPVMVVMKTTMAMKMIRTLALQA
jgi:hypothetical protein